MKKDKMLPEFCKVNLNLTSGKTLDSLCYKWKSMRRSAQNVGDTAAAANMGGCG